MSTTSHVVFGVNKGKKLKLPMFLYKVYEYMPIRDKEFLLVLFALATKLSRYTIVNLNIRTLEEIENEKVYVAAKKSLQKNTRCLTFKTTAGRNYIIVSILAHTLTCCLFTAQPNCAACHWPGKY